jgi:hypothetical protein
MQALCVNISPMKRRRPRLRKLMSMRYDLSVIRKVREIAKWKSSPYQTLIHQWIVERAHREWAKMARYKRGLDKISTRRRK